jgi:hypothetical protein
MQARLRHGALTIAVAARTRRLCASEAERVVMVACKSRPRKSRNKMISSYRFGGKNNMKIITLILALLALALGTGTAMVLSVQTQPVVACSTPNC